MTRMLLPLLAALAVAACSNRDGGLEDIQRLVAPGRAAPPARAQALISANAPRMAVSFPKTGRAGIVLLEASRSGYDTWLSAEGANLVTREGMLTGTRGFGAGLMAADVSEPLALVLAAREGSAHRFHSYLTGNDDTVTRTYACRIEDRGPKDAPISGRVVPSRLVAETCNNPDQSFTNLYWVSYSEKKIIMTRQWAGDFLGIVTTRAISPF